MTWQPVPDPPAPEYVRPSVPTPFWLKDAAGSLITFWDARQTQWDDGGTVWDVGLDLTELWTRQ